MYLLLKYPLFLNDVLSILRGYTFVHVRAIYSFRATRKQAELIYNNFQTSPHYERAVQSILHADQNLFVISFDLLDGTSIEYFKQHVQGPYATTDESTVRGYIAATLGYCDGFVHVPDTTEKAEEDMAVFGTPIHIF